MCTNRSDGSNRTNTLTRVVGPSTSSSSSISSSTSYETKTNNRNHPHPVTEHPTHIYPLSAIPFLDSVPTTNQTAWTNTRLEPRPNPYSFSISSSTSASTSPPPPQQTTTIDTQTIDRSRYNTYSYSIVDSQGGADDSASPFFVPITNHNHNQLADSNVVESKHDPLTVETETPHTPNYYGVFEGDSPVVTNQGQPQPEGQNNVIRVTLTSAGMTANNYNNSTHDSAEVMPIFYRPRDDEQQPPDEIIEPTTYSPVDFRMPTQRYPTPFTPSPTTVQPPIKDKAASPIPLQASTPVELKKLQRGTFPPSYTATSTKPTYLITTLKSAYEKPPLVNRLSAPPPQTRINSNSITDSIQSFTSRNLIFKQNLNKTLDNSYGKHIPRVSPYQSLRTLLDNEIALTTTTTARYGINRQKNEENSATASTPPPSTRSYFLITAPPDVWSTMREGGNTAAASSKLKQEDSAAKNKQFYFFKTKENVDLTTKPLKNYVFYSTPNSIDMVEPTTYVPKSRFVPKQQQQQQQEVKGTKSTSTTTTTTNPPVTLTTSTQSPTTTTEVLTKRKVIRMRFQLKNKKKFASSTTTELPLAINPEDDDDFESVTQPLNNGGLKENPSSPTFTHNNNNNNNKNHRFSPPRSASAGGKSPTMISNFSITNNTENLRVRSNFMRNNSSNHLSRGSVVEITDKPVYFTGGLRKPPTTTEDDEDDTQWRPIVDPKILLLEKNRQRFRATVEMPEFNIPTESELASFIESDDNNENSNQIEEDDTIIGYNSNEEGETRKKTDAGGVTLKNNSDLNLTKTSTTSISSSSTSTTSSSYSTSTVRTAPTTITNSSTSTTGVKLPPRYSRINPSSKGTISATLPRRIGSTTTTTTPTTTTTTSTTTSTPLTPSTRTTTTTVELATDLPDVVTTSSSDQADGGVDSSSVTSSSAKAKCIDNSPNSKCNEIASRYYDEENKFSL